MKTTATSIERTHIAAPAPARARVNYQFGSASDVLTPVSTALALPGSGCYIHQTGYFDARALCLHCQRTAPLSLSASSRERRGFLRPGFRVSSLLLERAAMSRKASPTSAVHFLSIVA